MSKESRVNPRRNWRYPIAYLTPSGCSNFSEHSIRARARRKSRWTTLLRESPSRETGGRKIAIVQCRMDLSRSSFSSDS